MKLRPSKQQQVTTCAQAPKAHTLVHQRMRHASSAGPSSIMPLHAVLRSLCPAVDSRYTNEYGRKATRPQSQGQGVAATGGAGGAPKLGTRVDRKASRVLMSHVSCGSEK